MATRREKLGAIWTDVAAVIVGDPCRLVHDERRGPPITREEIMAAALAQAEPEPEGSPYLPGMAPIVRLPSADGPTSAIQVNTLENCDGWCHVFLERDREGRPRRLIVDLNARVEP